MGESDCLCGDQAAPAGVNVSLLSWVKSPGERGLEIERSGEWVREGPSLCGDCWLEDGLGEWNPARELRWGAGGLLGD